MPAGFFAGQPLSASRLNAAIDRHEPLFARKTSDQVVVNNSTVLVNITGLVLPMVALAEYDLDTFIVYDCAVVADFKLGMTVPALTTVHWVTHSLAETTAGNLGDVDMQRRLDTDTRNLGGAAVGTLTVGKISGHVLVGANAGNLQFQGAQAVANASDLTVRARSWMKLRRVA